MRCISYILPLLATSAAAQQKPIKQDARPNIVFILTDDQDLHLQSLDYMPLLNKHITREGTYYKRHYCTTAICCPSRVSLLTGRNAHNTNVTDVNPPYGGYPKFISQGFNDNYLPVWLQQAGYATYYTGKLFNAHTVNNYDSPYPAGWTTSDFFLDPHTYQYLNVTTQRNCDAPVSWEGYYSTDVLAMKAYGLLEDGIAGVDEKPFFLTIAPIAPHSNVHHVGGGDGGKSKDAALMTTPIPAERHKHLFPDVKIPRNANFNPKKPSGVSWIKHLERLNETLVEYNDAFYRARLQTLQAVDEIIEGVISRLEATGLLDNTYVIFSSDNGYHISQHRLPPGKECAFEEDVNIPLIVRGPEVPKGEVSEAVTAHIDLAPTFLKIAGVKPRDDFDGSAIPLNSKEYEGVDLTRQEHVNVEFWGRGLSEGNHGYTLDYGESFYASNNTYKALRIISPTYNILYTVWCTNEHELYDLTTDPGQLQNLYPTTTTTSPTPTTHTYNLPAPFHKLIPRLDALLMVTKSCQGDSCREPWSVLHPAGNVRTLGEALNEDFDGFYAGVQAKVEFERCELGYLKESEGAQTVGMRFGEGEWS